jgi:hypothetical protein
VFASNRDPALTEYLGSKPASNKHAYVTIHSGALTVPPEKYMEAIRLLQPDMFVALADEVRHFLGCQYPNVGQHQSRFLEFPVLAGLWAGVGCSLQGRAHADIPLLHPDMPVALANEVHTAAHRFRVGCGWDCSQGLAPPLSSSTDAITYY